MSNKKGFTLVELLAVLVILVLIAIIAFPSVTKIIKGAKDDVSDNQMANIERVLETYIAAHADTLKDGDEVCVSDLKKEGLLTKKEITDPKTGKAMMDCFKISWDNINNQFSYNHIDTGTVAMFAIGSTVNSRMLELADNNGYEVESFKKSISAPSTGNKKEENIVSMDGSPHEIYMWYDNADNTMYWWSEADNVFLNPDSSYMFDEMTGLEDADLSSINAKYATDISYMFDEEMYNLTTLNISNWNLAAVTNYDGFLCGVPSTSDGYYGMELSGCGSTIIADNLVLPRKGGIFSASLIASSYDDSLNMSSWDTSHVVNATSMVSNITDVTALDLSGWDLSNATDASYIFSCSDMNNITGYELWDTSNITNFEYAFSEYDNYNYTGLSGDIDLSNWVTSNVTNMDSMFKGQIISGNLNISGWDTSNVTNMGSIFDSANISGDLNLSGWDTSEITSMYDIFSSANISGNLNISGWTFKNNTLRDLVGYIYDLGSITANNIVLPPDSSYFAEYLSNIEGIETWDTSHVISMYSMFEDTTINGDLDLSGWDTSKVTDMDDMFGYANISGNLNLSGWDTSKVTDMNYMFSSTNINGYLDISGWIFNSGNTLSYLLDYASVDSIITNNIVLPPDSSYFAEYLSNIEGIETWDTSNVTNMSYMFSSSNISGDLDLSSWNTSKVTDMSSIFSGTSISGDLNISNLDFTKFFDFNGCEGGLRYLGLDYTYVSNLITNNIVLPSNSCSFVNSNLYGINTIEGIETWDVSNVIDATSMFAGLNASEVSNLDLRDWDTSNLKTAEGMFCSFNFSNINVSGWNLSNLDCSYYGGANACHDSYPSYSERDYLTKNNVTNPSWWAGNIDDLISCNN